MHRSNHPSFSLSNCITMENRLPLTFVPKTYTTYFINSKRRFFLYFKYRDQMSQVIKIFQKENIRFFTRKSLFPDRQELEEIVFHCNYKYKKKDIRWALHRETRIRQPINRFHLKNSQTIKENSQQPIDSQTEKPVVSNKEIFSSKSLIEPKPLSEMIAQQTSAEYVADFGEIKIKNSEVLDLLNNLDLIKALFKAQKRK